MSYKNKQSGFTLVELSIVIILIGLIVAAVSSGVNLIKLAKLRGVISEVTKFKTAINTFKLEYNAIPGDFDRATDYWGASVSNGNGNKSLLGVGGDEWDEGIWLPEHLSMAKLIEGNYNGEWSAAPYWEIGVNSPRSGYSDKTFYCFANLIGSVFGKNSQSFMSLGTLVTASGGDSCYGSAVTPNHALYIDTKLDDGNPSLGRVLVVRGDEDATISNGSKCVNQHFSALAGSASFLLSDTSISCSVYFYYFD